jgi:calnexin
MLTKVFCVGAILGCAFGNQPAKLPTEKLFFYDTFEDSTDPFETGKWIKSKHEKYVDQPIAVKTPSKPLKGLEDNKGLHLTQENKHYGVSTKFAQPLDVKGKDLVIQYDLKLEDGLQCGGAYIKLLRDTPDLDLNNLHGETPYTIMFGPDKCGNNNKVHFIVQYQNPLNKTWAEHHYNTTVNIKTDKVNTHLYTLQIKQNNDFEIYIDKRLAKKGNMLTHMRPPINPSPTIDDPDDVKPADWVEDAKIEDPNAVKPADWDDNAPKMIPNEKAVKPKGWLDDTPEKIPDPNAVKPEDWDDEEVSR